MQDSTASDSQISWPDFQNNWDDFRIFGEAARLGSFSTAAKQLGMTQPTVSRRVKSLEQRLGVRLFDRFPHGLDLTPEGVKVLEAVRQAEAAFAAVRRNVGGSDGRLEGSVRLCVPEGIASFWLVPRLSEFQAMHPNISVEMICSLESADQTAQVADISIAAQRPTQSDLVVAKLSTLHFVPWVSPDYLRRFGAPATPADLSNHLLLDHEYFKLQSEDFAEWLAILEAAQEHRYWINSSSSMLSAVRNGVGITLLPTYFCEFAEGIVPLDLGLTVHAKIWLAYRPQVRELARVRVVIDWIKSLFDQDVWPWFADAFVPPKVPRAKVDAPVGRVPAPSELRPGPEPAAPSPAPTDGTGACGPQPSKWGDRVL